MKGIFKYLGSQSNLNDEVIVTQSSFVGGDKQKLLDIERPGNYYYTHDKPNSWICFEFKNYRIIPSNYSIKSWNNGPGKGHPKSWRIEISNDKNDWISIDEQNNCSYLNGPNLVHTFSVDEEKTKKFVNGAKFIRMIQTGLNWANLHYLCFGSI